jgi:hypothetical protein
MKGCWSRKSLGFLAARDGEDWNLNSQEPTALHLVFGVPQSQGKEANCNRAPPATPSLISQRPSAKDLEGWNCNRSSVSFNPTKRARSLIR